MKIIKKTIRKILAALGYELTRSSYPTAETRFNNFVNLAQAYEQRLNETEKLILPNEIRHKLLARLLGTPPSEAYYIIQALARCKDVDGDLCEFGVAQGETSALIANEVALSSDKILHLFDSFEGLPKPSEKDVLINDIGSMGSIEAYSGTMSCPENKVRNRLKTIAYPADRYIIHKGFIEQLIGNDKKLPKKVSFAYVDFDFYEPIKLSLEFLHQVTPSGAIIIVDDYYFFSAGSKIAVDEFIEDKNSSEICYECFVPDIIYGHFAILTKKANRVAGVSSSYPLFQCQNMCNE